MKPKRKPARELTVNDARRRVEAKLPPGWKAEVSVTIISGWTTDRTCQHVFVELYAPDRDGPPHKLCDYRHAATLDEGLNRLEPKIQRYVAYRLRRRTTVDVGAGGPYFVKLSSCRLFVRGEDVPTRRVPFAVLHDRRLIEIDGEVATELWNAKFVPWHKLVSLAAACARRELSETAYDTRPRVG